MINRLYLPFLILSSTLTLLLTTLTYFSFSKLELSYSLVLSSWEQTPIIGIKVIPSSQECSKLTDLKDTLSVDNYTSLVLNTDVYWTELPAYDFRGFHDGCDCRDISYYRAQKYRAVSRILYDTDCNYNRTRAGCMDIQTHTPP